MMRSAEVALYGWLPGWLGRRCCTNELLHVGYEDMGGEERTDL